MPEPKQHGSGTTQDTPTTDQPDKQPDNSFTNQPGFAEKEKQYQADRERLAKEHEG